MLLTNQEVLNKKKEYFDLLNANLNEQKYQDYLEENTMFIPREFLQNHGIHFKTVFRKLPLSHNYKPDFVYLSKSSDNWNVILVEIEKPSSKYFKKGTCDFHADFNNALQQINTWRSWFSIESNKNHFKDNILQGFLQPVAMTENPFNFKYVLVHGRREEYKENPLKRSLIRGMQRDDFTIISFDSLAEDIESKHKLYIGVKRNNRYELVSKEFICDGVFSWVDVDLLAITQDIHDDAMSHPERWYMSAGYSPANGNTKVMSAVLPEIKII